MIGDRWGVADAEMRLHYPCDTFVPNPAWQAWRGVTVDATPDAVWPWIAQIRLAPYSYDWIDNFGRRSPRELQGLPDPKVGDPFTATTGRPIGAVVSVEPEARLTAKLAHVPRPLIGWGSCPRSRTKKQPARSLRQRWASKCPATT